MIDIETLGQTPGCAIYQIAAVEFCPDEFITGKEFCINIHPKSSEMIGLHTEEPTLEWHRQRGVEPDALNGHCVRYAFQEFARFLTEEISPQQYWCKSTSFDFPALEHVFRLLDGAPPWKYWQQYDMRTVWNLAFPGRKTPPAPHTALADCHEQIKQLATANDRIIETCVIPLTFYDGG